MASSGHGTAPVVDMLLRDGRLVGDWILDPSRSQIRLRSKSDDQTARRTTIEFVCAALIPETAPQDTDQTNHPERQVALP
jgi:hypothetical protein